MQYKVFYTTRWLKNVRFCGAFTTLTLAYSYIDFLQNKFPNGKKIIFKIEKTQAQPKAA